MYYNSRIIPSNVKNPILNFYFKEKTIFKVLVCFIIKIGDEYTYLS